MNYVFVLSGKEASCWDKENC